MVKLMPENQTDIFHLFQFHKWHVRDLLLGIALEYLSLEN